ncbi:hypothetical protein IQ255_30630 [Pleurocapsales cyanobacterium LEGE 10410]|nr:hypothetical protein [Pleurocapsales cyanobacterium LEGE 10410]
MSIINNTTRNNRNWTTQKLIDLSKSLELGYGFSADNSKATKGSDSWTTDRLINMSRHLSSAYGVDF